MERKIGFSIDEHYHLYSRGVDKRKIFMDKSDSERFLSLLYVMNQPHSFHFSNFSKAHKKESVFNEERKDTLVDILAYTLMPNHFHLLVYEKEDGGISKFMMKLLTAYSMYFNKKYKRSGPLFVHPFRSQHIVEDSQYLWIFSYIHMNPLKMIRPDFKEKGILDQDIMICEKFLESYRYSSFYEYSNRKRPESKIINLSKVPEYLINTELTTKFFINQVSS